MRTEQKKCKCTSKVALSVISIILIILTLGCVFSAFSAFAADVDGDYITNGTETYVINNAYTLVDADLALLRWRAIGDDAAVSGVLGGESVSGFDAVYGKIYDMLLGLYDDKSDTSVLYYDISKSNINSGDKYITDTCPTLSTSSSTVLWKITGEVDLAAAKPLSSVGRIVIISEDSATINYSASESQFTVSGKANLSVQGRSADTKIKVTSTSSTRSVDAFKISGGSLYLQYADLNGFKYGSENLSVIAFPTGNYARYLYMSDSYLRNITGGEGPGIFCEAYATGSSMSEVKKSKLYINYSEFSNCLISNGSNNTVGGSAIRSYAADVCNLTVKNCTFDNNRVGSKTTAQNGKATGGGAIYWKSVSGKATLIGCTFTNNHSSVVGGAILNMGTMDIIGCHFENNTSLKNGGAIAVETPYTSSKYTSITGSTSENKQNNLSGTLTLDSETKIINNTASQIGGGIYFNAVSSQIYQDYQITKYKMQLIINGAEISGNTAGSNGGGVGIYLDYDDREYETGVTINEGSIIANNTAAQNGGSIWINSAADCDCKENLGVVMNGGTLDNNTAANGGAIYINAGKPDTQMNYYINGGTVTNNSATASGGAAYINSGSVIMSAGDVEYCTAAQDGGSVYVGNGSFSMSGGTVAHSSAERNGGAVYVDAGDAAVSGGKITDCSALDCGGAIYMRSGSVTLSDEALLQQCFAKNGGGAYLGGGNMTVLGGSIYKNTADQDGGGAYLAGGSFTVTAGTISENKAINGAGALVANGNVFVSGGVISQNEAEENGGAFSITNGNYKMTGGVVTRNKAINGDGGAIYVSSSQDNTSIVIRSGSLTENSAGKSGGALGIRGQQGVAFTITIGSNTHHEADAGDHVCQDGGDNEPCPVIKNNVSATSGGGIYLSGSFDAVTNLYCLIEEGNKVGDGVSPSNFMKVEGGTLNIDTLGEGDQSDCGNVVVNSSIHVTGGKVTITGSGSNPLFNQPVTVDVDSSQGASFDDKREGGNARTIQYFENFEKQGAVSGQYTLIDFLATEDHVVRANMYTNVGYEVDGWILMKMENGEIVSTGEVYKAGTTIENDGDLIFYAKWVVAGYTVVFTPGVDSYIGSMQPQDFAYSDSKELTLNEFINVGYIFDHWVDSSDPAKIYSDGQIVSGLSNVHGTKITLVAVWRICNHNGTDYTLVTDGGMATRECSCLGYKETVTLEGVTSVYDGEAHGTTAKYDRITLNDLTPTEIWNFEIRYSGISFGEESLDGIIPPTNAGNYTASITIDAEHGISVDVIIKKADPEPPAPPKYNTQKLDDKTNVIMVEDPNDDTGFTLLYQFSWYEGNVPNKSEWIPWNAENPPSQELEVIYTNYYVDVKYEATPNYNESAVVRGNTVIVYTGQVTFNISSDKGILREEIVPDQQSGIRVTMTPQSGYYIYNITHTISATIPEYILPTMDYTTKGTNPYEPWVVWIKNIENYSENVVVKIHFSGVEKTVVVDSVVTENQIFGNIPNTATSSVTISRDSSCTMLFTVNNYKNYETPYVEFDRAMPIGTTAILIDKTSSTYWSCDVGGKTIVYLSEFVRMGGTESFDVGAKESFTLALVVDFSRCANTLGGDSFSASLKATPQQPAGLATVPNFDMIVGGTNQINLVDAPEFGLSKDAVVANGELVQKVSYRYAAMTSNAVATSKWNAHGGILIVQPTQDTELPPDARLQVVINNATNIYPLINGRFVVAIPDVGSDTATLTLLSDMIPNETLSYKFDVSMDASATRVKSTPANMALNVAEVRIEYAVSIAVVPALSVELVGELPEYRDGKITPLRFNVQTLGLPANYTVRADLYSKNEDNGEYRHTTQTIEDIDVSDVLTLELTSFEAGMEQKVGSLSLMLTFEIVDPNGKTLTSIPLYFVIIDTRQ